MRIPEILLELARIERDVRADVRRNKGLILTQPSKCAGAPHPAMLVTRYNTLVVTLRGLFIPAWHLSRWVNCGKVAGER